MKLAVMQPYFFPYLGYFQLIHAVDKFVFYDDVNFIKKGWINRNRILVNQHPVYFTVPLSKVSQNSKTCETEISQKDFQIWKKKFLMTLEHNYVRSPFYLEIYNMIINLVNTHFVTISEMAKQSIQVILKYLNINTEIVWSSEIYGNANLRREERILNICLEEKTTEYINLIGGKSIYSKTDFQTEGVKLDFLEPMLKPYPQNSKEFIPSLSIVDVLMNNSKEQVQHMLLDYELQ